MQVGWIRIIWLQINRSEGRLSVSGHLRTIEKFLDLPAFPVGTDNLFFGKNGICAALENHESNLIKFRN